MGRDEVLAVLQEKATESLGIEGLLESDTFSGRGVDSLAVIELVMDLEDAFGIELSEQDVQGAADVGGLVDVVVAKTA
jgi:acyl carrier protein